MRTLEQIDAAIYNALRHRQHARLTIEQRLEQIASLRIAYAAQGHRIDNLLDERNALLTQVDVEEAA
jgi:hypothetical protein